MPITAGADLRRPAGPVCPEWLSTVAGPLRVAAGADVGVGIAVDVDVNGRLMAGRVAAAVDDDDDDDDVDVLTASSLRAAAATAVELSWLLGARLSAAGLGSD